MQEHGQLREMTATNVLPQGEKLATLYFIQCCTAGNTVKYLLGFNEAYMSQYVALKYIVM